MATSCRDFEDARTPYKAFVVVKFTPRDKHTKLQITSITEQATNRKLPDDPGQLTYALLLDPCADSTTFVIESASPTSPDTLTITYQRIVSLISHECGAQLEFVLKKVDATFAGEAKIINDRLSTLHESATDIQVYF